MKVLVAVEKNPETFVGLRYAFHLLENSNARIDALHVRPDVTDVAESYAPFFSKQGVEDDMAQEMREVEDKFNKVCKSCSEAQVPCGIKFAAGDAAAEILNVADTDGHDMIVLGSHEESYVKGFLLGAVHAKILHHAQHPVLIVRQFRIIQKVLIVYRGSATDDAALKFTSSLLLPKRPELTLLHVQEAGKSESDEFASASLQKGAQILRKFDYEPITRMAKGEFIEEILKDVAVNRYDLVVLGAYGHSASKYTRLISDEALNLARMTTRPILVFRDREQH